MRSGRTAYKNTKTLVFAAAAVALLSAVLLGAGEIMLRVLGKRVDIMEVTGRKPIDPKDSAWMVNEAFCAYGGSANYNYSDAKVSKSINDHGFISSPDIPLEKAPGTIRIAFLGGSSTAGVGYTLGDTDTWPWLATETLRSEFPGRRIEFLNGALGSFTSFESYGRLWARIRFFKPDIVVVYHGWNEMYYFARTRSMDNWRVNQPDGGWNAKKKFSAQIIRPLALDTALGFSQIYCQLRYFLADKNFEASSPSVRPGTAANDPADGSGKRIWRENLSLIRYACKLMGAELFVCKQATLIVDGLPEKEQNRCRFEYHGFGYREHLRAFEDIYKVIDEEIDADNIIDLTPLSGKSGIFFDHIHPLPDGARQIAWLVARKLAPSVKAMAGAEPEK